MHSIHYTLQTTRNTPSNRFIVKGHRVHTLQIKHLLVLLAVAVDAASAVLPINGEKNRMFLEMLAAQSTIFISYWYTWRLFFCCVAVCLLCRSSFAVQGRMVYLGIKVYRPACWPSERLLLFVCQPLLALGLIIIKYLEKIPRLFAHLLQILW